MALRYPPPDQLFKYRNLCGQGAEFLETTLRTCSVYFASPTEFEDLFDCHVEIEFSDTTQDYQALVDTFCRRYGQTAAVTPSSLAGDTRLREAVKAYALQASARLGIYSLCERPDSSSMWISYADEHRGLCLRFETSADFGVPFNVTYSDDPVRLNFPPDQSTPQRGLGLMLTKTLRWAEEEEWRIIDIKNGPGLHAFSPELLSGVIFGARMPEAQRSLVRQWLLAGGCSPELLEAQLDTPTGRVQIIPHRGGVG
jgi:hypothetical protein